MPKWISDIPPWMADHFHPVYTFFNWFFTHGWYGTLLFIIMCMLFVAGLETVKSDWVKERQKKKAVVEYSKLGISERTTLVAGILALIVSKDGISSSDLQETTGLHEAVVEIVCSQLAEQSCIQKVDTLYWEVTAKGMQRHSYYQTKEGSHVYMGDVFNVGDNSILINRSTIRGSLYNLSFRNSAYDQNVLEELAARVTASGNADAIKNLDGLLSELDSARPHKGVLTGWMNGLVSALPSLLNVSELLDNLHRIIWNA